MNNTLKNVLLHLFIVFGSVISTTLAATNYNTSKAAVIAAVSAASAASLHYLSGLIPSGPTPTAKAPTPPV